MRHKYSNAQHKEYLNMVDKIGAAWLDVFKDDTEFYSAAYWDLLTGIWRSDGPVRKTDALRFMKTIKSPHTAGKYMESAIRKGILVEAENPDDARSRLVLLSPVIRGRLNAFFDKALGEVRHSSQTVDSMGSPRDAP
jgi:hypothetical protein